MSTISPITQWLDHLIALLPPKAIHLVGAGNGCSIWAQWLAAHCQQLSTSLVEANPQHFAVLQRQQAAGQWPQATLLNAVIAPQAGDVDFFTASLTAESGLLPAEDLQALWPNVHTVSTHSQPAMDLGKLLQLGTETPVNQQWVLLDCLPAAALLRSLHPHLQHVDVVVARVLHNADGPATLSGKGCSLEEVSDALPGFRVLTLQASRHPALAHALFVRDYHTATQQVQASLQAQLLKAQAETAELVKKHKQQVQALQADLRKAIQAMDATQLTQALQPLTEGIDTLAHALKQQNTELGEKIDNQNAKLFEKIDIQSSTLVKVRKHLESTIKKETLNATQQLEAFLNIQSFFLHGEYQPLMHGWPLSPDFALYLIGLLAKNDYDLILEFGSGTSTVIMAKALARLNGTRRSAKAVQVAFEHLEKYHAQTCAELQAAGMADAAQVVLAPLQLYTAPNGNTYPYYACHEKLAELACSDLAASRKILVVVDGPPESTGKHARYPALPAVLSHFKNSAIDFLLDDYQREDEKEVGNLWINDCEIIGFTVKSNPLKMEKEALLLSIQPR